MRRLRRNSGNGRNAPAVRYAVVGLGSIAQKAVLPAFVHARENSVLTTLISDDPVKHRQLGRKYDVERGFSYDQYDEAVRSGEFDAVYIALPNSMHAEYTIRAAEAGIHVLCEKPMAVSSAECERMIEAAREAGVQLMIAYRLHFDPANLEAIRIVQSGRLGQPRLFESTFTMNVKPGDIRLSSGLGGGPLNDIGIYCINAARYLFREEPVEVSARSVQGEDPRFREVPEAVSAILRFPEDKLASFTCSFNAGDVSAYRVVGTRGDLTVEPAYEYAVGLKHRVSVKGKAVTTRFGKHDQFAPELVHFSDCVQGKAEPSPTGEEGLADVRIIEAINQSIRSGQAVTMRAAPPPRRPTMRQATRKPPVRKPQLVHASSPTKGED